MKVSGTSAPETGPQPNGEGKDGEPLPRSVMEMQLYRHHQDAVQGRSHHAISRSSEGEGGRLAYWE